MFCSGYSYKREILSRCYRDKSLPLDFPIFVILYIYFIFYVIKSIIICVNFLKLFLLFELNGFEVPCSP